MDDPVEAVAELFTACAWPLLTLLAMVMFRTEIRSLLTRLRKGGLVEFDPPPQAIAEHSEGVLPSEGISTAGSEPPSFPRTPAVVSLENAIRRFLLKSIQDPPTPREQALLTMCARALLISIYERVEGQIWSSQLRLLEYLNLHREGVALQKLKTDFYDPAAKQYPDIFPAYPFESYMAFLTSHNLAATPGAATITDQGREYLSWRIEQRRSPKVHG